MRKRNVAPPSGGNSKVSQGKNKWRNRYGGFQGVDTKN
jgi:hypothetical protein